MNLFLKIIILYHHVFIISLISFLAINALLHLTLFGELNPNITPESIEQLKSLFMDLDKPLYIQFFSWLHLFYNLIFGISFSSGEMVKEKF